MDFDRYNSIGFFTGRQQDIWTLTAPNEEGFSKDFVLGFCYGIIYGLDYNDITGYSLVVSGTNALHGRIATYFNDISDVIIAYDGVVGQGDELYQLNLAVPDKYLITLDTFKLNEFDNDEFVYIAIDNTEFLQGLFTALQSFNLNYYQVILTKPYKNGIWYDIQ